MKVRWELQLGGVWQGVMYEHALPSISAMLLPAMGAAETVLRSPFALSVAMECLP
jgi:hypothetical protein